MSKVITNQNLIVFAYYVPVGGKTPQRVKELLRHFKENCLVTSDDSDEVVIKNIIIPVVNQDGAYVECIYPSIKTHDVIEKLASLEAQIKEKNLKKKDELA